MADFKDKVPPHNLEAEQAVLGSILFDWRCINDVTSVLRKDHFYSLQNQVVYEALLNLKAQNIKGDTLVLMNQLEKEGNLEKAGGTSYISSLTDKVPTSANVMNYVSMVRDCYIRRSLILCSQEIKAAGFDETKKISTILEDAEKSIFAISQSQQTSDVLFMRDVVTSTINMLNMHFKNRSAFSGIPSGFTELDNMTSGFQNSEMTIIGARPSMGKTALALSMIQHIAIENKIPCAFFSLEMASLQIGQRLLTQIARIPATRVRNGQLTTGDFQKLQDACSACYDKPLYIVDTPNMGLLDLCSVARKLKEAHDIKIIFIDYIGLITSEHPEKQMFEQQSEISKSLKSLARELNIPVVVLCQVARDAEGNEPTLAQLRGSGSIEQDADMVMFIHGDRSQQKNGGNDGEEKTGVVDRKLIVAKQRNGPIGDVELYFLPSYTKFENKDRHSER